MFLASSMTLSTVLMKILLNSVKPCSICHTSKKKKMMSAFPYIIFKPKKLWLKILNRNGSKLGMPVVPLHFNCNWKKKEGHFTLGLRSSTISFIVSSMSVKKFFIVLFNSSKKKVGSTVKKIRYEHVDA